MNGPYADAARDYLAAGWTGVLPLPPRSKTPPPPGHTGVAGADPSGADVWAWTEDHRGGGNLALRLPSTLVGIDVDDYAGRGGAATLAAAEHRHGPLPPTWTITSRSGTPSGVRLYRVPAGTRLVGALGPGVDVVQFHHRYVVAPPSIHPEGRPYRWTHPQHDDLGNDLGDAVAVEVPRLEQMPELPAAWMTAFGTSPTSPTRRAPRRTRPAADVVRPDELEVLARPGTHHRDWITAKYDDQLRGLRGLRGDARHEAAAVAGFLAAQVHVLGLADDVLDRLAGALARHPDRPELVAAARAGHARARTVRWVLTG